MFNKDSKNIQPKYVNINIMNTLNEYLYQKKTIDLFENLVYFKDLEGKYILCNDAFCKYTNYTKDEIIGKTDLELFENEDALTFTKNDQSVIDTKKEHNFCEILTLNDGTKVYFESKKDIVLDENNKLVAIICISKDITKEKEYESLHTITQKTLEYILKDYSLKKTLNFIITEAEKINKNMICSILLLNDKKTKFKESFTKSLPKYYNDAVKTLTIAHGVGSCGTAAYTKERIIVEDINTHPYWRDYLELTKPLNLNACWSEPFFTKNNEVLGTFAIYYKKSKKPTKFELKLIDSFSYLVSLAVNRSLRLEEIKKQENLITQQAKLGSLSNVLENIAHHWRQPLSLISTVASGMKIEYNLYSKNKKLYNNSLAKIINTTQNLSKTIDEFRDYFLRSSQKNSFNIEDTFQRVIRVLEKKFEEQNIHIEKNIHNCSLYTYETEIIHILINIINNSIEAIKEKKIKTPIIFVDIKEKHNDCIITIKDNAQGVEKSNIDKIFEPYFTTKDKKSSGVGLSLYIVQDLVKRHLKGFIEANNTIFKYNDENNKGLEVKITIPKSL
ncbi:ATP-binding protein [Arcobacter sp. YIC-310]|uniref:ATP-binding protein n=1 Tax=Arcobacter sp. YIC-310 TaxID=3376632 RepID=UPI003C1A1578